MEIYKKISLVSTPEDADDLYDELCDRFGEPPKTVVRLIGIALCRAIAERAKISRVKLQGGSILFHTEKPDLATWSMVLDRHSGRLMGGTAAAPVTYRLRAGEDAVEALRAVLTDYYNYMQEKEG